MAGRSLKLYVILGLLLVVAVGLAGLMAAANARYSQLDQALQVMAHVKTRYVESTSLVNLFRAFLRTGTIVGDAVAESGARNSRVIRAAAPGRGRRRVRSAPVR